MFVPIGDWNLLLWKFYARKTNVLFVPIGDWNYHLFASLFSDAVLVLFVPIGDWNTTNLEANLWKSLFVLFVPIGDWNLSSQWSLSQKHYSFVCTYRGLKLVYRHFFWDPCPSFVCTCRGLKLKLISLTLILSGTSFVCTYRGLKHLKTCIIIATSFLFCLYL